MNKKQEKYVRINLANLLEPANSKRYTEIIKEADTNAFIKKCIVIIELIRKSLKEQNIAHDFILLTANMNFLCNEEYAKKLKAYAKKRNQDISYDESANIYNELIEKMANNVSTKYVPLTLNLQDLRNRELINDQQIKIEGIVNFPEFLFKMNSLGYEINLKEYGNCESFNDYLSAAGEYGKDTNLEIITKPVKKRTR